MRSKVKTHTHKRFCIEQPYGTNGVVAWMEVEVEPCGGVQIDAYGHPLMTLSQIRKLSVWLADRADEIESVVRAAQNAKKL